MSSPIFCNNCGNKGHAFRDCKKPVLSCGIILLRNKTSPHTPTELPMEPNHIEVLMIRRKDSMTYTEFIRGKYDVDNEHYIQSLIENMTYHEIEQITTQPFEKLWSSMFGFSERYGQEFELSRQKYESVKHLMRSVSCKYTEPEWGFPKGRRYRVESDTVCAEREFNEETNIPRSAYILLKDVSFKETFLGTNGIPYEHKYFVGLLVRDYQVNIQQRFTSLQKREISGISWKTIAECKSLTRPHHVQRDELIESMCTFLKHVEAWIPPLEDFHTEDNGNLRNTFST